MDERNATRCRSRSAARSQVVRFVGRPQPVSSGWAFVLVAGASDGTIAKRLERHGGEDATTNNRMEMTAALQGLRALTRPTTLAVFVDSA